jgi:hypothetical protein
MSMVTTKTSPKKPHGDTTRTARAVAHLDKLKASKGKRLVVDIDSSARDALNALLDAKYGATQRDVVIKALLLAQNSLKKG